MFQMQQGGLSSLTINGTGQQTSKQNRMIEGVLNRRNIMRAYSRVKSNQGSAGVDGMSVKELYAYLNKNREQIESDIRKGKYLPQPVLGAEIKKSNGKKRLLGIPTAIDRLLQQAVGQILAIKFEMEFEDYSYGFRPNRNAQQAVLKAQQYINDGYHHIVDIDIKAFFDEVNHCLLLQLLYRKVKCPFTLRLIRKWMRAPILINGKLIKRRKGVPQGSPLSPLLSNIMLNELDKEMERRGLRYVRYADDFSIYTKSEHTAQKIGNIIYLFLRDKLKLPINREKSGIRKPVNFKILGYGFVPTYVKGEKGKYQLIVSDKSWKSLKEKLKTITRKTTPMSLDERIQKLIETTQGWLNYFRMASIQGKLKELDGWLRNRLRYCIWHNWKKPERKRKNLIRLGVEQEMAYQWSRSRMGGWAIAQSPILGTTITLERLCKRGYESLLTYYEKVAPHLNEPLYTRPVRTVV
jgi:group II intron reverse transcriptase/maturase